MIENSRVSQYIFSHRIGSTLACYDTGTRFDPSNRQRFSSFFYVLFYNLQTVPYELEFTGFMFDKLFDKKTLPQKNCKYFIHVV